MNIVDYNLFFWGLPCWLYTAKLVFTFYIQIIRTSLLLSECEQRQSSVDSLRDNYPSLSNGEYSIGVS